MTDDTLKNKITTMNLLSPNSLNLCPVLMEQQSILGFLILVLPVLFNSSRPASREVIVYLHSGPNVARWPEFGPDATQSCCRLMEAAG